MLHFWYPSDLIFWHEIYPRTPPSSKNDSDAKFCSPTLWDQNLSTSLLQPAFVLDPCSKIIQKKKSNYCTTKERPSCFCLFVASFLSVICLAHLSGSSRRSYGCFHAKGRGRILKWWLAVWVGRKGRLRCWMQGLGSGLWVLGSGPITISRLYFVRIWISRAKRMVM